MTRANAPFTVWYSSEGPIEISTIEDLDELLDRIAANPAHRQFPVLVSVQHPQSTQQIQILVGRDDLSLLIWYLGNKEIAASKGTIPTDEEIVYDWGGATEAYSDTAITVEAARQALREFVSTHTRPTSIEWKLPDFD